MSLAQCAQKLGFLDVFKNHVLANALELPVFFASIKKFIQSKNPKMALLGCPRLRSGIARGGGGTLDLPMRRQEVTNAWKSVGASKKIFCPGGGW